MPADTSIDAAVLQRAVAGDRAAIEPLCQRLLAELRARFGPKVAALARPGLSLDDLVQHSLAEIIQCLGDYRPRPNASFLAWACRITEHNLTDALRGLDRRPAALGQAACSADDSALDLFAEISSSGTSPSQGASRQEAIGLIRSAIAQLANGYRFVIEKYDLERWPIEDVAAALGQREGKTVSPGAVFMRRGTACRKLARLLGNESNFF